MIPHSAILADASAALALAAFGERSLKKQGIFTLGPDDVHISYLPLAHIFERLVFTAMMIVGASVGYYQGDNLKLVDDIAVLRPTVFCSVPRLLNRIYDKVMGTVKEKGFIAQALFDFAYKSKIYNLKEYGEVKHWLWDAVVFSKIRAKFGGRIKGILSGAAPISPDVMDFLRVCLSCEVYEGYGATETCAGTALTVSGDLTVGHVGVPVPSNEVKLVDIPEMGYTSQDKPFPRGEVCVRGPNCFVGYFKDEEKTRETIDADGWVHTGDVGEWDDRGRLKIIDRKKNLFKLAQGEYIAPEKIELHLTKNPFIQQAFVHGDSLKSSLVVLIVPERDVLLKWTSDQNEIDKALDYSVLLKHDALIAHYKAQLASFGRNGSNELKGFEIPRELILLQEPFTIENDLLTPSFKVKRFEVRRRYQSELAELLERIKE
jgi:long-chain acyl-CoA synthetase